MVFLSSVTRFLFQRPMIFLIVLVGFLLRIVGTNPGYYAHGDEAMYGEAIYMLINKTLSMEVHLMGYPPLIPWIMLIFFTFVFIPLGWLWFLAAHINDFLLVVGDAAQSVDAGGVGLERIFHSQILGRNWTNVMYWGRYVTALFGTGAIILTYNVALTYFNKRSIALVAAFFVAVNYRLVLNSRIGFPDTFSVFFLLLALWSIGMLLKKPSAKAYFSAWVTSALSFLVKYQVYALVPLFLVHTIVSARTAGRSFKKFLKAFFNKNVIVGGLIAAVIVLISHVYHFANIERVIEINNYEAIKYGFGRNIVNIFPISYLYHIGIGPFISVLAFSGILFGLLKKQYRIAILVLLSPVPVFLYLYFYYTVGGFFTRNFLALIPLPLLFASIPLGVTFDWFLKKVKTNILGQVFIVSSLLLLLFLVSKDHTLNSLISAKVYSQPSPHVQARQWVQKNIKGDLVYGAYHGHPTPFDSKILFKQLSTPPMGFGYRELFEEGYDIAVVDFSVVHDTFLWWMTQPTEMGIRFFKKPDDLLSQNYMALATREYLWGHTLKAFLTPWQAPGYNYAIVSTKKEEQFRDTKIMQYDFNKYDIWDKVSYLPKYKDQLEIVSIPGNEEAVLSIKSGTPLPGAIRWQSKPVVVKPGYGYAISAFIRSNEPISKDNRNGFLRLDFYDQMPKPEIDSRATIGFVSKRVYGDEQWQEVYVQGVAPGDSQFMVVGFQADSSSQTLILKQIKVVETSEPMEDRGEHITIPDEDFFLPNNNGFL